MRYARLGVLITSLGLFAWRFQPGRNQWLVDGLWVLAVCLWVIEVREISGGPVLGLHVSRDQLIPIAAVIAVFAAAWLPFYANWRWAYTGDSITWFQIGAGVAGHPMQQNILSVHGVDDNFTYLHGLAFNSLMFVFRPTLFWHRVGKLVVSCLSLTAIYAYFTLALGRWWGTAVVLATATNYVWLWFSYVSYGHMDSYIFYFLSLIFAQLICRRPDQLGLWMLCGLVGGLSLFFTQTSWSAVAAVGLVLGVFALVTRRFVAAAVYALSFLLAAMPILLQFSGLLSMATRQTHSAYEWNYLRRIFMAILKLPYTSDWVAGGVLRWPLSVLYVAGLVLAAVTAVPALRRLLRVPVLAPVLLALLLWDMALMTLTNNGYGSPSNRRTYNLIPLQVFFALLPLYAMHAWCARWRVLRAVTAAVALGAICVYAVGSFRVIAYPTPGQYGSNTFDGLIELRQRFPSRSVLLLTSRRGYRAALGPEGFFNKFYRVLDQLSIDSDFSDAAVQRACEKHSVLCTEPNVDHEFLDPLLKQYSASLKPFPLLNSKELICYECVQPVARQRGAGPAAEANSP